MSSIDARRALGRLACGSPPVLVLAILLGGATAAHGQEPPDLEPPARSRESYASPQHFWFEFKLGPYIPNIDSEFGGRASPYHDIFDGRDPTDASKVVGDGKNLIFNWEFDWEVWRPFGTLAIGASLGYFTNTAKALQMSTASTASPAASGARSGSDSTLTLLPLAALVIYRFDWAADHLHIPLVPYVKFGLNYTFWWMLLDGDVRQITRSDGSTLAGKGGTFGWQVNAGLAFRLDVLEPEAARALDSEIGINHTYLFFELAHIAADGLGASSALQVGDTTWSAGLAFEF